MSIKGHGHSLTLVKGHSDFKVKCLTFGLYTQMSDSGPYGPLVSSHEPRAPASIICRQHFHRTSSLKWLCQFELNFICSLQAKGERKFKYFVQVTWPRWHPCPYMAKTLKKSSSPEPLSRLPKTWYVSSGEFKLKFKVYINNNPILWQGQIWSPRLLNGKSWKSAFLVAVVLFDTIMHSDSITMKF